MVRRNEVVVLGGVSAGNHDFLYRGIIERLPGNHDFLYRWIIERLQSIGYKHYKKTVSSLRRAGGLSLYFFLKAISHFFFR